MKRRRRSARPQWDVDDRLYQAGLWVDRLYLGGEGYVYALVGHAGHFPQPASGIGHEESMGGRPKRYTYRDRNQLTYRWPEERDRCVSELVKVGERSDVHIGPMLRSQRLDAGKKGFGIGGDHVWADLDSSATAVGVAKSLVRPGTLVVNSGSKDSWHIYLMLAERLEAERIEGLNGQLARFLGSDMSGTPENKVLRLPGTYNHKARAQGGQSSPVRILFDGREWLDA